MTRPSLRRTPMMERLETRQVLSSVGGPSDAKQYALELINLARTNPHAAAERFTSNLSAGVETTLDHFNLKVGDLKAKIASTAAKPPLAYSDDLGSIAQAQSQAQADTGQQTHLDKAGKNLDRRLDAIGYTGRASSGENTYAYSESNDHAIEAFAFDWGVEGEWHYRTLFEPDKSPENAFNEVGIGITKTANNGLGPLVITQDFASRRGAKPQILGVVYGGANRDNFYTPGEGKGGVTIEATNLDTGKKFEVSTWNSGGYQVAVDSDATYRVTDKVDGKLVKSQDVYVSGVNEKVDFILTDADLAAATSRPAEPETMTTQVTPADRVERVAAQATPEPSTPPSSEAPAASQPTWLAKWSKWRECTAS